MGVALMVLYPVLYTDVTDAWRLTSRRQRLAIDVAGVITELIIATIATVFWVFLPDGDARSVCFVLATTGWILTLAVNLNPFMRFDGYYFLADLLGVENIGPRSFALGRWWIRRTLFGLKDAPPETFKPGLRRGLIAFACATWVYRLFLFLGIALLVYAFFFKLLGVILFAVEILWFVVMPVLNEIKVWWVMKNSILRNRRTWITMTLAFVLLVLFIVPWQTSINAPAVLQAGQKALVYPPEPAQIETIHVRDRQTIALGEPLFTLKSPDLEQALEQSERRISLIEKRLARRTVDAADLAETIVLQGQLRQEMKAVEGYRERLAELVVKAPINGHIVYVDEKLTPNLWVGRETLLVKLVNDNMTEIRTVLSENAVERISIGTGAIFIADDPQLAKVPAILNSIAPAAQEVLSSPYFSGKYGGPIAVEEDENGRSVTVGSVFSARLTPEVDVTIQREQRGVVRLKGESESIARSAWRRVAAVLIREAAF
jgi:putative peptide zinc metalloprotease protein